MLFEVKKDFFRCGVRVVASTPEDAMYVFLGSLSQDERKKVEVLYVPLSREQQLTTRLIERKFLFLSWKESYVALHEIETGFRAYVALIRSEEGYIQTTLIDYKPYTYDFGEIDEEDDE